MSGFWEKFCSQGVKSAMKSGKGPVACVSRIRHSYSVYVIRTLLLCSALFFLNNSVSYLRSQLFYKP